MKKLFCLICVILLLLILPVTAMADKNVYIANPDGKISLRLTPEEEGKQITNIPACAEVELIRTEGTWGLVVYDSKCGWLNMSYTRDSYSDAVESTGFDSVKNVKVNSKTPDAILYSLPATTLNSDSEKKFTVPNGVVLKIIRETPTGWGLVSMNGEYAWIELKNTELYRTEAQEVISRYDLYYVYVLSSGGAGLSMYSDTGAGSVVKIIPDCTQLAVRETRDDYAYVSHNGISGWVDLKYTTKSLLHAQANAGEAVNKEYVTVENDGDDIVEIYNVPSDDSEDSAVLGKIKANTYVFVQRRVQNGWLLVNHKGVTGWINPKSAKRVEKEKGDEELIIAESKQTGFLFSDNRKGINVYSEPDKKHTIAYIPECAEILVVAKKDKMAYVLCNEASGWVVSDNIAPTYEKAVSESFSEKKREYTLTEKTELMNIPVRKGAYKSESIGCVPPDTKVYVMRAVRTDKETWGLIEFDGQKGWVNLETAEIKLYAYEIVFIIVGVLLVLQLITMVVVFAIRRIKSKVKKVKKND